MRSNTSFVSSVGLSAPVSKASQDNSKITTVSLSSGPQFNFRKWSFSVAATASSSWYSQTELTEGQAKDLAVNEQTLTEPLGGVLLDAGQDHSESTAAAGSNSTSGLSRELNRYGGKGGIGYKILSNLAIRDCPENS